MEFISKKRQAKRIMNSGIVNGHARLTLDLLWLIIVHDLGQLDSLELAIDELETLAQTYLHLTQVLNIGVFEHIADEHWLDVELRANGVFHLIDVQQQSVIRNDRFERQNRSEIVVVS